MFGIGAQELILILVVALLVFGPKRLPELARSLGRSMAEFRRASNDLRRSLSEEEPPEPKLKRAEEYRRGEADERRSLGGGEGPAQAGAPESVPRSTAASDEPRPGPQAQAQKATETGGG